MSKVWESINKSLESLVSFGRRQSRLVGPRLKLEKKLVQLRNQRHALVRQRNRLFLQMGAKVYSLHQRDKVKNADLLALCKQADERVAKIEELVEQIEAAQREFDALEEIPEIESDEPLEAEGAEDTESEATVEEEGDSSDAGGDAANATGREPD